MEWMLIIGLIVAGLLLLVLEVLVIPGVGVVGFFGFALIIFSMYRSFAEFGTVAGLVTTVGTLFMSVLVIWLSLRSKTWRRISLNTEISSKVNLLNENEISVGDSGVTIGRIAPMGKALFNNRYFEVKSGGAFIDPDIAIIVSRIDGNQIFVKEIINHQ